MTTTTDLIETDDPTETAILDALRGGEFAPWAVIRRRVPSGTPWARETALHRLWRSGRVSAVQLRGSTYVALADDLTLPPVHLAVV